MQIIYVFLCIVGTLLPLSQFVPWLTGHGLNVSLFIQKAVTTPISAFAWSDVAVSALVLIAFVLVEGRRLGMSRAWLSLLGLAVGVSLALPLFLLLRERHLALSETKNAPKQTRAPRAA